MAPQITPIGWRCTDALRRRAEKKLPKLLDILRCKVEKFRHIPGVDTKDLLQEARLAAVYAVATWDKQRGKKLRGWVDFVVRNALLAHVNWDYALKRYPREDSSHRTKKQERRLLVISGDTEGVNEGTHVGVGRKHEPPHASFVVQPQSVRREGLESSQRVERILSALTEGQRKILLTKMTPPPRLLIAARNLRPTNSRITNRLVADYLCVPISDVELAIEAAKIACAEVDADDR